MAKYEARQHHLWIKTTGFSCTVLAWARMLAVFASSSKLNLVEAL